MPSCWYRDLDYSKHEIRVLQILGSTSSATRNNIIHVTLKHVSLDDRLAEASLHPEHPEYDLKRSSLINAWRPQVESGSSKLVKTLVQDASRLPEPPNFEIPNLYTARNDTPVAHDQRQSVEHGDLHRIPHRFEWGDFEAVSYCWESDVREKEIRLDDFFVLVPKNLEFMLQKLQYLPEARSGMYFWIDGLCIDQDNKLEKNHQVQLMKRIYQEANSVIVWLGDIDDGSDQAMDLIAQIADVQYRIKTEEHLAYLAYYSLEEWRSKVDWRSVLAILSRNYWKRMWIIQELALNWRTTLFLCGNRQLPRDAFWRACEFCMRWAEDINKELRTGTCNRPDLCHIDPQNMWDTARDVYNLFTLDATKASLNIVVLLDLARKANVTDTRDKVYGLLGILPESMRQELEPEYHTKTKEDVYRDFAAILLKKCARLDEVLSWCSFNAYATMPSWIPDWSTPFNRHHLRWLRKRSAGGNKAPICMLSESVQELRTAGLLVGKVDAAGLTPSKSIPNWAVGQASANQPLEISSFGQYKTRKHLVAAVQRTLLHDHPKPRARECNVTDIYWIDWDQPAEFASGYNEPDYVKAFGMTNLTKGHHASCDVWMDFNRFRLSNASFSIFGHSFKGFFPDLPTWLLEAERFGDMCDFTQQIRQPYFITRDHYEIMKLCLLALGGRRLVTTETGYLGLAPNEAEVGDNIAVLYGCNFPVVLRKCGDGFKYVGECYIDGLMDGEAVKSEQRDVLKKSEIIIC